MAADYGITGGYALLASAPAVAAGAMATAFSVPTTDYFVAVLLSLVGIVARHCWDASRALDTGTFGAGLMLGRLAIDLPTAPMLGILAFVGASAINATDLWTQGIIIGVGFLGPEPVRGVLLGLMKLAAARAENGGGK